MKRFFACAFVAFISLSAAFAQDKPEQKFDWKNKIQTEKIAYLSAEMNLSPEEAQVFWPVYNQIWEEKEKARHETMTAFAALEAAIKAGKKNVIEEKLKAYTKSLAATGAKEVEYAERLGKVISAEKIAKLYLAEEKFRLQQMRRLHNVYDNYGKGNRPSAPQQPRRN